MPEEEPCFHQRPPLRRWPCRWRWYPHRQLSCEQSERNSCCHRLRIHRHRVPLFDSALNRDHATTRRQAHLCLRYLSSHRWYQCTPHEVGDVQGADATCCSQSHHHLRIAQPLYCHRNLNEMHHHLASDCPFQCHHKTFL